MPRLSTLTARAALGAALVLPATTRAQGTAAQLRAEVDRRTVVVLPKVVAWRRDIHEHPELSYQEVRTSKLVADHLRALGLEVRTDVGGHGVVGVLRGGKPGKVVALRADMDALPVREEVDVPFRSTATAIDDGKTVPVMHACGHDIHMSTLIGTARALEKLKDKWHGTILFIGQPAEEMVGGARAMLKDGLYTRWPKPTYALALHDSAEIEAGKIGVTPEYVYAAVDSVDVTVKGMGGHGAYPHKTKDPVVLSAEIINAWQTIVSREKNPLEPAVVTVGSIHGGTKHNIIPDEVKMQLTVRTYKTEVRDLILASIDRIAKGCAIAAGLPNDKMPEVKVLQDEHVNATYNNPDLTKREMAAMKAALGNDNVYEKPPTMGGEDFCEYSLPDHSIPALMFDVGAVAPEKIAESKKPGAAPLPSLHSSKFLPVADTTIRTGIIGMTSCVLDLMKR